MLAYTTVNGILPPAFVYYEPSVVQLTGTLRECICLGPPEYENIEMGDAPEYVFALILNHPVHVSELTPKEVFLMN